MQGHGVFRSLVRLVASLSGLLWRGNVRRYAPRAIVMVLNKLNPLWTAVIVFTCYYLVPLLLCIVQDFDADGAARIGLSFAPSRSILYLLDHVHLTFSIIVALAIIPLHNIIAQIGKAVRHTRRRLGYNGDDWEWIYCTRRAQIFHPLWLLVATACSASTFAILLSRTHDASYDWWWGNSAFGWAGVYFAFVASQMVLWGTFACIAMGAFSLAISSVSKFRLRFDPFNPEDCCRMRPIGFIILNMWTLSLAMAASVYVVFKQGYLGLEKNLAIWAIAIIASGIVPLIAIIPVWRTSVAIEKARDCYIDEFARMQPRTKPSPSTHADRLAVVQGIATYSTLPFKRRALTLLALINAVQFLSSLRELFGS